MIALLAVVTAVLQAEPSPPSAVTASQEETRLDIADRHIVEESYRAARAVRLRSSAPGRLTVDVGVALEAGRIDVRLRNVHGRVRFRADLGALRQRLPGLFSDPATPTDSPQDPSTR